MNRIICPKCGEVRRYGTAERIRRTLIFDANGNPCGSTEDISEYTGVPRCLRCNSKIKIISEETGA